jgi:hypothetical protein
MAPTGTATRHSPEAQLAEPTVLRRELAFVTGKGGVGKSTVAAALALGAIVNGRKAVACELSAQTQLASMFGRTPPSGGAEIKSSEGCRSSSYARSRGAPRARHPARHSAELTVRAVATGADAWFAVAVRGVCSDGA